MRYGGLHVEEVKARLRIAFGTVQAFEEHHDLPRKSVSDVLRGRPNARIVTLLEAFLSNIPKQICVRSGNICQAQQAVEEVGGFAVSDVIHSAEGVEGLVVRGTDKRSGELFSYVDLERRVRADHPSRAIRSVVSEALDALSGEFAAQQSGMGRPPIAPEMLLRAMLLQAFYSVSSERQFMERLEQDLLFRWFVWLGVEEPVWTTRPSRKTATGYSTAMSPPGSCRRSWRSHAFGDCCRAIISASTAHWSRPGRA